jgi:RNA-directed DNA polymerase
MMHDRGKSDFAIVAVKPTNNAGQPAAEPRAGTKRNAGEQSTHRTQGRARDARRFWDAMRKRFEEFSLSLHPEKTRLIEFGRQAADRRDQRGLGKPETFNFLGFTHICGRSRKGKFLLKRKSRRDRMRGKLKEIKEEMRHRMHQPIPEQGRWLAQVVRGYFAYHAVPTNSASIGAFRHHVVDLWRCSLSRRSQRGGITWQRIKQIADDWLPKPKVLHPWPQQRFAVRYSR